MVDRSRSSFLLVSIRLTGNVGGKRVLPPSTSGHSDGGSRRGRGGGERIGKPDLVPRDRVDVRTEPCLLFGYGDETMGRWDPFHIHPVLSIPPFPHSVSRTEGWRDGQKKKKRDPKSLFLHERNGSPFACSIHPSSGKG